MAFAFQQTAIVPALPTVQASLGASREWTAWLVTVYLVVATVATPAMGRLGDLHGRRRMLLAGLLVFMLGSVAAALAPDMPALLVFRAIQGVGGSVYPLTLALARRLLPPDRVTTAIALSTGAFGMGAMLGFTSGGLLAQYASWRWIFGAGAVVVGAAAVTALAVPASADRAAGGYDLRGTALLAAAAVALLVALTLVVQAGWGSPVIWVLLALTGVAATWWARLELRAPDPLIDVHIVVEPEVLRVNLATIGLGWALFTTYLLVPEFARATPTAAHYGLGASAAAVGFLLLPLAVGQAAAAPVAGLISRRAGSRRVFAAGLLLTSGAVAALSMVRFSAGAVAAALFVLGAGAGASLQTSGSVATEGVRGDVAAASSALNSTIRRLAGGIGGQIATIVLASFTLASPGTPSFMAFTVAYLVAAVLCAAGPPGVAPVTRDVPAWPRPPGRWPRGQPRVPGGAARRPGQAEGACSARPARSSAHPPCGTTLHVLLLSSKHS